MGDAGEPANPDAGLPDAKLPDAGLANERRQDARLLDVRLLELLACPLTKGPLSWDPERSELVSRLAKLAYPVRDGIPIMLPSEARSIGDDQEDAPD